MNPQLRFREFEGEWVEKKLGKIADLTSSKRVYSSDYVETGVPFFRGKEITELRQNIQPKEILFITNKRFDEFKQKYGAPKQNDILITAVGTLGNAYRVQVEYDFYFKDGNLIWLRNIKENPAYLEQLLNLNRNELIKVSIGSTQKALTIIELNKVGFNIPSIPEQTKIATFLTTVDKRISLLKKKKAELERYKKGVMQRLFNGKVIMENGELEFTPPTLRFRDDNGNDFPDWEEKRSEEVADITTGNSNRQDSGLDGEYAFFDRSEDIRTSSIYLFDGEAVIVAGEGSEFAPKYFAGKFDLHQRTYAIMNFNQSNGKFLFYYIYCFRNYFLSQAVGSTVKSLRLPMFQKMKIKLPSIPEQQKIADFLSSIDKSIDKLSSQIDESLQFKKGLLQKMFV